MLAAVHRVALAFSFAASFACGSGGKPEAGTAEHNAGKTGKADAKAQVKGDAKSNPPREVPDAHIAGPRAEPALDADVRTWHFDSDRPGGIAQGFRPMHTGEKADAPATWAVTATRDAPSAPHVFAVTEAAGTNKTFNLALLEGTSYQDLDLTVMLRPRGGTNNQGGGVVVRAKGPDDHYVMRWNPLESNFRIYALVGGARVDIASAPLELDARQWHQLRVIVGGAHMECFVDDKPVVSADDRSFPEAGMIGLWTKGDAVTAFDDLVVSTQR